MLLLAQLKWSCRRGTAELDRLLLNYVEKHYLTATESEQQLFEHLLSYQDSDLLRFFLDNQLPEEKSLISLVEKIRTTAIFHS